MTKMILRSVSANLLMCHFFSTKIIPLIIFLLSGLGLFPGICYGQGTEPLPPVKPQPFPVWMDNVQFPSDKKKENLNPVEPTEPEFSASENSQESSQMKNPREPGKDSAKQPPQDLAGEGKVRFKFKRPKMPDLSEFKKKATRIGYQRTASGSDIVSSETFEMVNIEKEESRLEALASEAARTQDPEKRNLLEKLMEAQRKRLDAAWELNSLIKAKNSETPFPATATRKMSLGDPGKENRIKELKRMLFPEISNKSTFPASTSEEMFSRPQSSTTYKIPEQFERPERPTSLYLEMKRDKEETEKENPPLEPKDTSENGD